jgi:hypothetical protein
MRSSEGPGHVKHMVALYALEHCVTGYLHSDSPRRVIDMLNDQTMRLVRVREASVAPWNANDDEEVHTVHVPEVVMYKPNVILAILLEEDASFQKLREHMQHRYIATVRKKPLPFVVHTTGFLIYGQIHAIPGKTPLDVLSFPDVLGNEFLVLTDVRIYRSDQSNKLFRQDEVIAINREHLSLVYAQPERPS